MSAGPGWLLILALISLLGLLLLLRGLRPAREGDTRYCRRCRYNLTGSTGHRCSECGADLTRPGAVLVGQRRIRRGRVWIGSLLLAAGLGGAVPVGVATLRSFDPYTLKPTSWVLRDVESGAPALQSRALRELVARLQRKSRDALTPSQAQRVADLCLEEQSAPTLSAMLGSVSIDLLGELFRCDLLSDEQRQRFLENLQVVEFRVRPRVRAGAALPARIVMQPRSPSAGPGFTGRVVEFRFEGRPLADASGRWIGIGSGGWGGWTLDFPPLPPGQHRLECDVELTAVEWIGQTGITLCMGCPIPPDDEAKPIHRFIRTLTATVDVYESPTDSSVTLRTDPQLEATMSNAVVVQQLRYSAVDRVEGVLLVRSGIPVGIAFRVTAEYDDRSVSLKSFAVVPHESTTISIAGELPGSPRRVTLVFEPSPEAAETSLDILEIWGGELRLTDVPIDMP